MDTGQRVAPRALLESVGMPSARRRTALWWAITICIYLAIACLAYWPVEPLSRSHLSYCACSDSAQETWFLAWPAYAIRHARDPFLTSYINAPRGVNLALNTSMPLLGIIASPITWLRGPVAAFNFMMRLSFVLSATSMTFVLRRFTRWWPAAFAGGLLYGFSPYMVGQGNGHLFLTFVPLPPLIVYCVYRLVRPAAGAAGAAGADGAAGDARSPRPAGDSLSPGSPGDVRSPGDARRLGLTLGVLCVLQFLISIEILVTTGLFVAIGLAIFFLRDPRRLARSSTGLFGILWALALFVPLVAFPTWVFLRGPQHVIGPPHAVAGIAPFRSDLLGPIVPTANEIVGPSRLIAIGTSFALGDRPENGIYIGIPLLVLLIFLVFRCRRQGVVLLAASVGLCALVLALGTPLTIDNRPTSVTLPFVWLTHVPVLQGILALRFSLYVQMVAAFVLGVGLETMRREGILGRRSGGACDEGEGVMVSAAARGIDRGGGPRTARPPLPLPEPTDDGAPLFHQRIGPAGGGRESRAHLPLRHRPGQRGDALAGGERDAVPDIRRASGSTGT